MEWSSLEDDSSELGLDLEFPQMLVKYLKMSALDSIVCCDEVFVDEGVPVISTGIGAAKEGVTSGNFQKFK
ncbi:hypothetical protein Tco_0484784 [Tanacetum coccineum]